MDIEIQEKHSDRIVEPKRQFHINYLISKCVQPALGNVKDPASDSSRASYGYTTFQYDFRTCIPNNNHLDDFEV
jgi:hypothetical protein